MPLARLKQPANAEFRRLDVDARSLEHLSDKPFRLLEQTEEEVFDVELVLLELLENLLRAGDGVLGAFGESIESHVCVLSWVGAQDGSPWNVLVKISMGVRACRCAGRRERAESCSVPSLAGGAEI